MANYRKKRPSAYHWRLVPEEFSMQITMYALAHTTATRGLRNLDALLDKALAWARPYMEICMGGAFRRDEPPMIRRAAILAIIRALAP